MSVSSKTVTNGEKVIDRMGMIFATSLTNFHQSCICEVSANLQCFSFSLHSLLYVETADRPGLLVDLVKIITDINVAVESGEFDTEVTIFSVKSAGLHC